MAHITPTDSWSAEVTNDNGGVIECRAGEVRISLTGASPDDVDDGMILRAGDQFMPPAGKTWKHIKAASASAALINWQAFPA